MVKYSQGELDRVFAALSDATRRGMLEQLAHGEQAVGDLAEPYDISPPAISRHLRVLEEAGLVRRKKDGRVHRIQLDPRPLQQSVDWVEKQQQFWQSSLDALADYVERKQKKKEKAMSHDNNPHIGD